VFHKTKSTHLWIDKTWSTGWSNVVSIQTRVVFVLKTTKKVILFAFCRIATTNCMLSVSTSGSIHLPITLSNYSTSLRVRYAKLNWNATRNSALMHTPTWITVKRKRILNYPHELEHCIESNHPCINTDLAEKVKRLSWFPLLHSFSSQEYSFVPNTVVQSTDVKRMINSNPFQFIFIVFSEPNDVQAYRRRWRTDARRASWKPLTMTEILCVLQKPTTKQLPQPYL
jgi:hypothetical protein